MSREKRLQFAKLMGLMALALDREPSAERTQIYWRYLKEYETKDLERAFDYIIKTRKFNDFPTIGAIRSVIEGEEDERLQLEAMMAWEQACKTIIRSEYKHDDELINRAVRLAFGSWREFGMSDDVQGRRKFMECYKLLAKDQYRKLEAGLKIKAVLEQEVKNGKG